MTKTPTKRKVSTDQSTVMNILKSQKVLLLHLTTQCSIHWQVLAASPLSLTTECTLYIKKKCSSVCSTKFKCNSHFWYSSSYHSTKCTSTFIQSIPQFEPKFSVCDVHCNFGRELRHWRCTYINTTLTISSLEATKSRLWSTKQRSRGENNTWKCSKEFNC